MLLAIDTSTRFAGVALADGDRVVATRSWYSSVNHTAELMPAVVQLLKSHAVAVKDLEGVAVALGPGGFSALRVGISVGKGLAAAGGIPILGVGSLDVEAFPFSDCGLPVCVFLEAGRGEVASALFRPDGERARDDRVTPPAEALAEIGEPTVFCGEGIAPWLEEINRVLGSRAVACRPAPAARTGSLAAMARTRLEGGRYDDPATLQPYYLRMPSIGVSKRRDRRPQASSRRQAG